MTELEELSEMYDEKNIQIIGIPGDLYIASNSVDEEQLEKALNIVDKTGVKYPILVPSIEIQSGVIDNLRYYPTTIFFDENGEQIRVVEGASNKDGWINIIEEVLASE